MITDEQTIATVMEYNLKGYPMTKIADIVGISYYNVRKIIIDNDGNTLQGHKTWGKLEDTTVNQSLELWNNGMTNFQMIADTLGTSKEYIKFVFYRYHKIREYQEPPELKEIAEQMINGTYKRGTITQVATKYGKTRQDISQLVKKIIKRQQGESRN